MNELKVRLISAHVKQGNVAAILFSGLAVDISARLYDLTK